MPTNSELSQSETSFCLKLRMIADSRTSSGDIIICSFVGRWGRWLILGMSILVSSHACGLSDACFLIFSKVMIPGITIIVLYCSLSYFTDTCAHLFIYLLGENQILKWIHGDCINWWYTEVRLEITTQKNNDMFLYHNIQNVQRNHHVVVASISFLNMANLMRTLKYKTVVAK